MSKICVLLTATIDSRGITLLKRDDLKVREKDYIISIKKWIKKTNYPLVFCENSGVSIDKIEEVARGAKNRDIEFLQFYGNDFPRKLGKGYGELGIIKYALSHSRILNSCDYIIKVTGRYYIKNFEEITNFLQKNNNFYLAANKARENMLWVDSIIFITKPAFIQDYLSKYQNLIDDSKGFYLEHALYKAINDAAKQGHKILFFEKSPFIHGYSGTHNALIYSRDLFDFNYGIVARVKEMVNRFFHKLKYRYMAMRSIFIKTFDSSLSGWLRMILEVLKKVNKQTVRIEKANRAYLAFNSNHSIFIREYYLFCVELFKKSLFDSGLPVNVIFGDYDVNFKNHNKTIKIDFQFEHTLVKPGGRDSQGAFSGKVPIKGSSEFYLVRLCRYGYLMTVDLIIEYNVPNMINLRECGVLNDYLSKTVYVSPLIYDMDFKDKVRSRDIITLFYDTKQSRRKVFLDKAQDSNLPLKNVCDCFDKVSLRQMFRKIGILVNVHQTDHHDTLEELRILPALLCGVIIVSEDVPLKEHVPYNEFIVWSSYENMVDTIRLVYDNYDQYYNRIFNNPKLAQVLMKMKQDNADNVDMAIRRILFNK